MTNNLIRGYPIGTPMSAFHQSWKVLKYEGYSHDWYGDEDYRYNTKNVSAAIAREHGDITADEFRRLRDTANPHKGGSKTKGARSAARVQLTHHWTNDDKKSDFVWKKRNEIVDRRSGPEPSNDAVEAAQKALRLESGWGPDKDGDYGYTGKPNESSNQEKYDAANQAYESALHEYGRLIEAHNNKKAAIRREVQNIPVDAWLVEHQRELSREARKKAKAHKKEMTGLAEEQRKLSRKAGKATGENRDEKGRYLIDGLTYDEHLRMKELMAHEKLQDWVTNAPFHRLGDEHGDDKGQLRGGKDIRARADKARWDEIEQQRQEEIDAPMSVGGGGGYPQVTLNPNLAQGIAQRSQPPGGAKSSNTGGSGRKATPPFKPTIDRLAAQGADTEGAQRLLGTMLSEQRRAQLMAQGGREASVAGTQHRVATSGDQLSRDWWSILKNPAMTAAQWQGEGSGDGSFMPASAENTSGGEEVQTEDPEEKRRKAEMEHSLSTNNESTQQWFDSILPSALDFRSKLATAIQTPGVAIHDPNHNKNIKPMMRAGEKVDEMIAHITSHKGDTPGKGRGKSGIPSIVSGEDDDSSTDPGFNSKWQDMNKGIINAFRKP